MMEKNTKTLNNLFINFKNQNSSEEINLFIYDLVLWLFNETVFDTKSPQEKLKFFLYFLDKNEEFKMQFVQKLKTHALSFDLFPFWAQTGINAHSSLFNEFSDRFFNKFTLHNESSNDFSHHLEHAIEKSASVEWIKKIENEQLKKLHLLIDQIISADKVQLSLDEAITYLVTQFASEGLNPKLQKKYFDGKINQSPFFAINGKWNSLLKAQELKQDNLVHTIKDEFLVLIAACRVQIQIAPELFSEKGVDTDLVFKIDKLRSLEKRLLHLFKLKFKIINDDEKTELFFGICHSYVEKNKLRNFYLNHTIVVAKQIIVINAQKAKDYMAKNREHYIDLFKKSLGGGVLTALTVILKYLISKTGLTGFWLGFFNMLNYALSFLAIHYLHYTLATKQPTSTASQIAHLLLKSEDSSHFLKLISEIKSTLKSQLTSVLGNLLAVIPSVLIFAYGYQLLFQEHFLSGEKALYTIESLKLFSLVPLYAIFTGVILWTTGLVGGWLNNFMVLYEIPKIVEIRWHSKHLVNHLPVIGSNFFLGFSLGVLPELLKFLSLPLDVRHITLSTGTLFLALPAIGFSQIGFDQYLNITLGLFIIAFFNIGTNFYLTIKLAFKASNISKERSKKIYKAVVASFFKKSQPA